MEFDIIYDGANKLDFFPAIGERKGAILYFHGGGLREGDKSDPNIATISRQFADAGYDVFNANYRMYPNAKFPDYLIDAAKAFAFMKSKVAGPYHIAGQSAGAWMSLMLATDKRYLAGVGCRPSEVSGWLIDSAQTTSHFNVITIEDGLDPLAQRIDEKAPLYFLNKESEFDHVLLISYENDMPNRTIQNDLFASAARNYRPEIDLERVVLDGFHCAGSACPADDGIFPFVTTSLTFLKR